MSYRVVSDMKTTTHTDFSAFLEDLNHRRLAGHKTWCKDSPRTLYLGFLDFEKKEWVRVGLRALKMWKPVQGQEDFMDALRTVEGRYWMMGKPSMKDLTLEGGQVVQVPDEPDWVDEEVTQ